MQSVLGGRVRGGAAVPSYPAKDFYFNDFAGIANGTTLRSLDGWSAYSSTGSTHAARDAWTIQDGDASYPAEAADYNAAPGQFIVGRDSGSTDHVFKTTVKTLPAYGGFTIAVAATDETNCVMLQIAYNGGTVRDFVFSKRVGEADISLVAIAGSNTGLGRNIAVGDRIELSVLGQRLYCRVNDHDISPSGGIDLDTGGAFVKGTRCGLGTSYQGDTAFDDIYVAQLTGTLTIAPTQIFWPGSIVTMGRAVPVSGTYLGDVQALDYRVLNATTAAVVKDWARATGATVAAGSWSADVFVAMCDITVNPKVRIQVRAANDTDARATSLTTAVGFNVCSYGQSNSFLRAQAGATLHAVSNAYTWGTSAGSEWRGGSSTSTVRSQLWAAKIAEATGIPCGVTIAGVGSASIENLTTINWPETVDILVSSGSYGYIAAWLWTQGEAESSGSSPFNSAAYRAYFGDDLLELLRNGPSVNSFVPVVICVIGKKADAHISGQAFGDANWSAARATLFGLTDKPGTFIATNLSDATMADDLHYVADAYVENGRRVALSMIKALGYGGYDGRGPLITGASRSGAVITLPVDLNGAVSIAGTGLTNYQVSTDDFATFKTISSAAVSGSNIVLTLSADPGTPVKVRSFYGMDYGTPTRAIGTYADATTIPVEPLYVAITSS